MSLVFLVPSKQRRMVRCAIEGRDSSLHVWPMVHVTSVKVEDVYIFLLSFGVAFPRGCCTWLWATLGLDTPLLDY